MVLPQWQYALKPLLDLESIVDYVRKQECAKEIHQILYWCKQIYSINENQTEENLAHELQNNKTLWMWKSNRVHRFFNVISEEWLKPTQCDKRTGSWTSEQWNNCNQNYCAIRRFALIAVTDSYLTKEYSRWPITFKIKWIYCAV